MMVMAPSAVPNTMRATKCPAQGSKLAWMLTQDEVKISNLAVHEVC